ncbi:MAG: putative Na+/H+ antiporter [Alphaproteobacteria bacterium]|nr:putative Na+/H+ antiporter [Alphaproteobacteria bacterium]
MEFTPLQLVASVVFAIAVAHTFLTKYFERMAHIYPRHVGVFHLLGEVEAVFGFWALVLVLIMAVMAGQYQAITYLEGRNYTEPMFVFVIMVVAASRPVMTLVQDSVLGLALRTPMHTRMALMFLILFLVPLLGSFITEPAAMTLAALLLRDIIFNQHASHWLRYGTLGVLFVNVSIGGTLTSFAAPPVLMVAAKWNWDMVYTMTHIGWRATIACFINAAVLVFIFRRELCAQPFLHQTRKREVPMSVSLVHVLFLAGVVVFAHHPVIFMGLFLFFLGYTVAYKAYQHPLILREALMVAFFLAGLVVLGGMQDWWLRPALLSMDSTLVYYGATALTAITDNAALTYLGSLVDGLSEEFKLSLVMGAVTGGGLTLIANAPNPAGAAILKVKFSDQSISAKDLLLAAFPATLVAIVCMRFI